MAWKNVQIEPKIMAKLILIQIWGSLMEAISGFSEFVFCSRSKSYRISKSTSTSI